MHHIASVATKSLSAAASEEYQKYVREPQKAGKSAQKLVVVKILKWFAFIEAC